MKGSALVTVGIPTYNRANGLERTLQSIRSQTYSNLDIVISDNASPDQEVNLVIAKAASSDKRIRHFTQQQNIGAGENFLFVLRQARGSFFMWAADDDYWHPTFIEKLISALSKNACYGLAFCDFYVLFPDGTQCNDYGSFSEAFGHFIHGDGPTRVTNYALQAPERGKANLIYGLFNIQAIDHASLAKIFRSNAWGSDMLFVCDVLSRWEFCLIPEKLYTVGISSPQPEQPLHNGEYTTKKDLLKSKLSLAASHLYYYAGYVKILTRTPGSNPIRVLIFIWRLVPQLWRYIKADLS